MHHLIQIGLLLGAMALGYVIGYEAATAHIEHGKGRRMHLAHFLPKALRGRRPDSGVVLYVLVGAALLAAGFVSFQGQADRHAQDTKIAAVVQRQAEQIKCLNDFAGQLHDSLTTRFAATEKREAALDGVLTAAFLASQQKAQTRDIVASLKAYQAATRELADERRKAPYPDPPREVCQP